MKISKIFKQAILNLVKSEVYSVDFAIIKSSELADKNKLTAEDYEDLLNHLAELQEEEMKLKNNNDSTDEAIEASRVL